MELKVLGSVSPYPKDNKNGVSNLITDGKYKILLDCGTGSTRFLNVEQDLNNLVVIISHLHKDHYSDLLALGYASYVNHNLGYLDKRIPVYIPSGDKVDKDECYGSNSEGWGIKTLKVNLPDYEYLKNFGHEHFLRFIDYDYNTELTYGKLKCEFALNPHQLNTYSIRIEKGKRSLVYSADTGFDNNVLTELAENADLLICESTFLKGQNKKSDNHLYAYEAAQIAKEANVKKLLLTHFYPEIDKQRYVDEAKSIFKNVQAAEEGKVYKIGGK